MVSAPLVFSWEFQNFLLLFWPNSFISVHLNLWFSFLQTNLSETTTTSPISDAPATENTAIGSSGDLQNIHSAYRLNGKNYLKWSQLVHTFHNPNLQHGMNRIVWWCHGYGIRCYQKLVILICLLEQPRRFGMLSDKHTPKLMMLHKFMKLRQKFQQQNKGLELSQNIRISCKAYGRSWIITNASKWAVARILQILKWFMEKDGIYNFLAGLNVEFDAVRVHILGKEDMSSLNETISIIRAEEGWRSVMLESHGEERSALVTKATRLKKSQTTQSIDHCPSKSVKAHWLGFSFLHVLPKILSHQEAVL